MAAISKQELLPTNQVRLEEFTAYTTKNEISLERNPCQNDTRPRPKKNSYSVEELLKKDVPEYTKIPNLLYAMPPCGLLLDKSCTCNLKFVSENT